jgi:hypothetical protein
LLIECELKDKIPKIKENQLEPEIFWNLSENEIFTALDVTVFGKKKILMAKINSIKKKNEEDFAKKLAKLDEQDDSNQIEDIPVPIKLFRVKSTNL